MQRFSMYDGLSIHWQQISYEPLDYTFDIMILQRVIENIIKKGIEVTQKYWF